MLNRNFFLGVLTTLLIGCILIFGGLFVLRPFLLGTNARFMALGRLEQHFERQAHPDDFGGRGAFGRGDNRLDRRGGNNFFGNEGRRGWIGFFLLRGFGRILGSLLIIGLIVAAVIGGQKLFKRFSNRPTPAPSSVEPARVVNAPPAEIAGVDYEEPAAERSDLEPPPTDEAAAGEEQNEAE
jgi:hypothetical protein